MSDTAAAPRLRTKASVAVRSDLATWQKLNVVAFLTSGIAAAHPELGREVARRLIWALNDESATNGVYGIPALGQIGRHAPSLVAPHVSALARMAWDQGLRLAILEALAEVARSSPDLVAPELSAIEPHVDASQPGEDAAWQELKNAVEGDNTDE